LIYDTHRRKTKQQNISITLPENFVGKQVEVIAFTIDEAVSQSAISDKPLTHLAAQKTLAKEWLSEDKDKA
jgi:hypothetical protein